MPTKIQILLHIRAWLLKTWYSGILCPSLWMALQNKFLAYHNVHNFQHTKSHRFAQTCGRTVVNRWSFAWWLNGRLHNIHYPYSIHTLFSIIILHALLSFTFFLGIFNCIDLFRYSSNCPSFITYKLIHIVCYIKHLRYSIENMLDVNSIQPFLALTDAAKQNFNRNYNDQTGSQNLIWLLALSLRYI